MFIAAPFSAIMIVGSARVSTICSGLVVRQRFFGIPATDTDIISAQHFWTGGRETAGPGCDDAAALRAAGFRVLVMSPHLVMRRLSLNRSEPGKKSGQNIPKNRCRTTIPERILQTLSGAALYRGTRGLLKPRPGRPQRDLTLRAWKKGTLDSILSCCRMSASFGSCE